ncbi:MAG: AmmeMemoRadiSam system protein B [Candidatus Saccharicenans sp.]|jgi:AmmeMemoRadiSam system protein B|nr:AmmeMemoRadiSam system protein B [Candidatus Saccharicenans sp.]MDH7574599.1 AmmeMemoRadiSam system protein B [Candidatus Saccharicenans sp.]
MNRSPEKKSPLRLRPDLEFQPMEYQGRKGILVSDRLGLIKNPVLLQGEALEVLTLIDGQHDDQDIRLEFLRKRGYSLKGAGLVGEILQSFRQLWLLDTPEFQRRKQELIQEFAALPVREPALAGEAYPEKPEELKKLLSEILELEKLPPEVARLVSDRNPTVLVAPHIDLRRGRRLYSLAYRSLVGKKFRRVIVLGTGHAVENGNISLTEKDFATPLGLVKTEKELVKNLKKAGGSLVAPDDFAHKKEHSIEFQLLFLQHLLGDDFQLVPVLFGSFQPWLETAGRASGIPGFSPFLDVLAGVAAEPGTLVVAGVDFCHVGPRFGHQQTASELKEAVVAYDHDLVEALIHWQPESFWGQVRDSGDRFNVCGFPVLASLLEIFQKREGFFLGYELSEEQATGSAVSFASLLYF